MYINQQLYPLLRDHLNINPNNLRIVDIMGDGNCLYHSIWSFVYGTEDLFHRVRQEIYRRKEGENQIIQILLWIKKKDPLIFISI